MKFVQLPLHDYIKLKCMTAFNWKKNQSALNKRLGIHLIVHTLNTAPGNTYKQASGGIQQILKSTEDGTSHVHIRITTVWCRRRGHKATIRFGLNKSSVCSKNENNEIDNRHNVEYSLYGTYALATRTRLFRGEVIPVSDTGHNWGGSPQYHRDSQHDTTTNQVDDNGVGTKGTVSDTDSTYKERETVL